MMSPGHETGFGLLPNSAIDQHVNTRGREADLGAVVSAHPESTQEYVGSLGVDSPRIFKTTREDHPKDNAGNVSGVSHSACLDRPYRPNVK